MQCNAVGNPAYDVNTEGWRSRCTQEMCWQHVGYQYVTGKLKTPLRHRGIFIIFLYYFNNNLILF